MEKYENPELGVSIDFPENWRHSFWGNRKKNFRANETRFQISYNDFPTERQKDKELFHSFFLIKNSPSVMSCQFSIIALYNSCDFDLNTEVVKSDLEIGRNVGDTNIKNIKCRYLYQEIKCEGYILYRKFIYIESKKDLILCFLVEGDTKDNFNYSKELLTKVSMRQSFF